MAEAEEMVGQLKALAALAEDQATGLFPAPTRWLWMVCNSNSGGARHKHGVHTCRHICA